MKIKEPKNQNYAAVVVEIKTIVTLEKCDNIQGAVIMGNQVIVSKDVKVGDTGLYFPLECALSKEYLSNNNLYKKLELNLDNTKKGYFDENGRVRCQRFRGHKSEGLFMPLESLQSFGVLELELDTCFDEINGIPICSKYVVKTNRTPGQPKNRDSKFNRKYESKLVENQFRFHSNTSMLYRNLHRIEPNSLISITYKLHGCAGVSSYVLCKKSVSLSQKIGAFLHNVYTLITSLGKNNSRIDNTEYDYIYASRKVIKNEELNPNAQHFYNEDIWGIAHNELESFLEKGFSAYYEIVGYLPSGGLIQKDYDYGFKNPIEYGSTKHTLGFNYGIFIYRITYTNTDGKVFEFSAKQVQDWCKKNGLNAVPELYYGYAKDFYPYLGDQDDLEKWRNDFLLVIKSQYNEKDCYMCSNTVIEEGVVIRIENLEFEAYKQKSFAFYQYESKMLDQNIEDIEASN